MSTIWYWMAGHGVYRPYAADVSEAMEREFHAHGKRMRYTIAGSTPRVVYHSFTRGYWVQENAGSEGTQWRSVRRGESEEPIVIGSEDEDDIGSAVQADTLNLKAMHNERMARQETKKKEEDPPFAGGSPEHKRPKRRPDVTVRTPTEDEAKLLEALQQMKDANMEATRTLHVEMGREGTKEWTVRRHGTHPKRPHARRASPAS